MDFLSTKHPNAVVLSHIFRKGRKKGAPTETQSHWSVRATGSITSCDRKNDNWMIENQTDGNCIIIKKTFFKCRFPFFFFILYLSRIYLSAFFEKVRSAWDLSRTYLLSVIVTVDHQYNVDSCQCERCERAPTCLFSQYSKWQVHHVPCFQYRTRNMNIRNNMIVTKRTWGDREGHWGRWLWYVIVTKVNSSFRKSVFWDVRTDYNLDLRFLVNFSDNSGFVVGTHKHFSWGYKRSLLCVVYLRSLLAGYATN